MNLLFRMCQRVNVVSDARRAIIVRYIVCSTWQKYSRHHSSSANLLRWQHVHFLQRHVVNAAA